MRLQVSFALLVFTLLFPNMSKGQTWAKKTDFPGTARHSAYCFSINNKIYLGGGTTSGSSKANDFYEFDVSTGAWTKKGGMPIASGMTDGIAFTINGKGYIGLGQATQSLKSLWEYNPATDTWTPKAELPYFSGVYRSRVFVVNNKAYVLVGAASNQVVQNDLFEYDPSSNTWSQKAAFPNNGRPDLPFTFAIGNKGYVACGLVQKTGGGTEYTKKMYEYDAASNTWTPKADFPGDARQMGVAFSLNGMGYCGLGQNKDAGFNDVYFDDFYIYDPTNNTWKTGVVFPGGKSRRSVATVSNSIAFVGVGEKSSGVTNEWYQFSNPTDISHFNNETSLTIFPNPTNGIINLQLDRHSKYSYGIYSIITGSKIREGFASQNNTIDISELNAGQYIFELVTTDNNIIRTTITLAK